MIKNLTSGTKPRSAYFALLTGLSFMCFAAIFTKASEAPGIITTFYRMFIGALALVIPFIFSRLRAKTSLPAKGIMLAILGGVCFGNDMALWSTAVVSSNATIPTLFANMAPLWAGIGAMIFFKERHQTGFWIGLVLAFTGVAIIIGNDFTASNGIIKNALKGLAAGVFYGIFYLIAQSGRKLIDTLSFLFIFTATSAALLAIYAFIFGYNFTGYSTNTWLIFFAFGIGVQVIGWYFINYSQGFLTATIVAPTLLGQPILTALLAALLLNERLTILHLIGGMVVIAGIYTVHYSRQAAKN